ncbi:hypothetical protein Pyn_31106 [Prunus yedoensis var. nudiflora]|uniref:Secreted protein n=1 Tax=Prunus yedoensis var. nudiflora TaxID=2094558 RepID=A0A314ZEI3_PRUYE|nr:hypothetical protein Pyn_31106 [Prunus yedoensis var. nudiflora]
MSAPSDSSSGAILSWALPWTWWTPALARAGCHRWSWFFETRRPFAFAGLSSWNPFVPKTISPKPISSFPLCACAKRPRIKRGLLISYSTLPHVPSIARLLLAVRYYFVAAPSSIRYWSLLWN